VAVAPFVHQHEGRKRAAYDDQHPQRVLKPGDRIDGTLTICDGHTGPDVHIGDRRTNAECDALLQADLHKTALALAPCIHVVPPPDTAKAITSFGYNVGAPKTCRSTMVRKLNAGDLKGACAEMPRWRYAAGVVLKGLITRRIDERSLCERGL
jgi:lysozyme